MMPGAGMTPALEIVGVSDGVAETRRTPSTQQHSEG